MSNECKIVHSIVNEFERHSFPFAETAIPANGIYILFERSEIGHGLDRVVRVGTHTGDNQLRSRLKQHFLAENKDRSIFRKNIGRALLNKRKDPFLEHWNLDLTTRRAKDQYSSLIDFDYQKQVETEVSQYIRESFTFGVFEVESKEDRLDLESKIISTVSWCNECKPSPGWLGNHSPRKKIVASGLWLVNELYKTALDAHGLDQLSRLAAGRPRRLPQRE
jgi:hypothetical protein